MAKVAPCQGGRYVIKAPLTYGLTGGIASGKSSVAELLVKRGMAVLDADKLYHGLLTPVDGQPSALANTLQKHFKDVLLADGQIDRAALGRQVFKDPSARQTLEHLTHPAIRRAFEDAVARLGHAGVQSVIYDVPLLFERDMQAQFAGVMVVWVDADLQKKRLMARNHLSEAEAEVRIKAQWSLDAKRAWATWVIDNSQSQDAVARQIDAVVADLHQREKR